MSHQPSSLSLNDVGALEQAEPAALEDARASSEPPPGTAEAAAEEEEEEAGAVIVDVEDVEEETAAPLLVARGAQGHTPVYCYAPDEVTRLIDSSGSESDKDSARAARTESSFKLLQEGMDLLGRLKIHEDACRQIESKMGNIEAKIDHVTKTHEEEIERLKREEEDMFSQEASTDDRLGQLRDRILDLEIRQQRLLKEGATLQESFAEQSEQQAVIARSLADNFRLLRACSGAEAGRPAEVPCSLGDAVAAVQDLASGLLALAERLEASLARRSRDSRSPRLGRDGQSRPPAPRFRTGHQRYSEEGTSLSAGSLHSEDGESGSLVARQTSEDIAHLPAQLAVKVLELKQALNRMCAQSEASAEDQTGEDNAAARPSEEASTATFVVEVGKKRSVPQAAVHVDSEGNMSPVSVTITPAFWKRRPEDAGADRNDATSSTARGDPSPDPTTGCADAAGTDRPDAATKTSRAKSGGTDDAPSECRSSDDSNINPEVENNATVGETSAAAPENQNKNEKGAFSKESSNRLSRQKKLLKTRRVSDVRVGCDGQSEGKAKIIRRQKECDERCERDSLDGSAHRKDDERQPEPRTSLQDVTRITPELTFEEYNFSRHGWPSSSEGPIVNSRTTFLVNDSRGKTTSSSPVNVFVPTTRKIFSPIRRDSKGKTSTVISYVVAESSTERPSNLPKEPESKEEGDKEENKLCNGIAATPAARILRENRSHSSSPCLKRKQLCKQEQTCRSKEELRESPGADRESRPLANGAASESELDSSDNSTRKTGEERLSPSKAFPPLSPGPAKRELNRSVSKETAPSIRLMIARYNQKLTEQEGAGGRSPDVSHSGSGSPVAWRSPATERRVRLQTEKYQEEVRKVLQAEVQKSASAGVIRSPERREEHARHPVGRDASSRKPPTAVVQPRGILKSSSAGAIKPACQGQPLGPGVLPPPEQFKDGSPGPSSPSSPELEEPLRLRQLRLQRAKEEFLSRGPGGRSWASEGGGCRLSHVSVGSESSFDEGPEAPAAAEADPLLVKSASAGMISVEPGAFRRLSAEGEEAAAAAAAAAGARSRFGLAGIASRFRKVKMRRAKGRDAPGKLNTVSMLCRQSLLVDLHQAPPPPPPSSKSCPSSPVLRRSGPPAGDEAAKATGSWLRRPAKIFKPKQQ
ncbi:uncharacterized protein LOC134542849 [Bacillus rossius redtenbacheri]|uniref:uncharacterized protein LOC134542849 n=1 Tax=Bacillus rossius redtenbacheri TaxID=93214 RepID=UPI002FDE5611